jgi:hypothetical protein
MLVGHVTALRESQKTWSLVPYRTLSSAIPSFEQHFLPFELRLSKRDLLAATMSSGIFSNLSLSDRKIIVGIDFGTTYSGLAWAETRRVRTHNATTPSDSYTHDTA